MLVEFNHIYIYVYIHTYILIHTYIYTFIHTYIHTLDLLGTTTGKHSVYIEA